MRLIAICALLITLDLRAATITAASASRANVANAVASASSGDTIVIPSGEETWTDAIDISIPLTIQGSGTNSTKLMLTGDNGFSISGVSGLVKIEQLWTTNTTTHSAVLVANSIPVWVSDCEFHGYDGSQGTVYFTGYSEGLVSECYFSNCKLPIRSHGDNSASWGRPIVPGTTNCVVVEDCVFYNGDVNTDFVFYHQDGGRSTIRYNTFDAEDLTSFPYDFFDSHGNWDDNSPADPDGVGALDHRGQPLIEFYGNTVAFNYANSLLGQRGGSMICYSNTFTRLGGSTPFFTFTDEEMWSTSFWNPLRTEYPAHDQVTNTFFWANTLNGDSMPLTFLHGEDAVFIQENRDYWLVAPAANNGNPAGVYYPYTRLRYPHPLRPITRRITTPHARVEGTLRVGAP